VQFPAIPDERLNAAVPVSRAPRKRRALLLMLGGAAAAAVALPIAAIAGPGGTKYPDLRSDPPASPYTEVYSDASLGVKDRYLMRFWGFVVNVGQGPLDIAGNPRAGTVRQRGSATGGATATDWTEIGDPPVIYESADGHDHFHLKNATAYSLRNGSGGFVAPAQKTGFCLYDSYEVADRGADEYYRDDDPDNRVIDFCSQGKPNATWLRMGTSAGWRDDYNPTLAFQWVDISNVAPGEYRLQSQADPDDEITEANESNPPNGSTPATVPGYLAKDVSTSHRGAPATVTLQSTKFGSPGALRYKVVQAPSHGTINRVVGQVFTDPNVVYTPNPGSLATDSFRYVALNGLSGGTGGAAGEFPLNPPQATASVVGTNVAVAIGGAPAMLYAGTAADLSATVSNAGQGVTWSVDGVPGGSAASGTITPDGVYTAPATPPPGGLVRVRATSAEERAAYDEVAIRIEAPPAPKPAPSPPIPEVLAAGAAGPGAGSARPAARVLTTPAIRRKGRVVYASVRTAKAGRVVITGVAGKRRYLRRCVAGATAGRVVTCRMKLGKAVAPRSVRVIAVLKAADGTRASTRARVVPLRGSLSKPAIRRTGRVLTATVTSAKAGRVVITGVAGKRRHLRRCVVEAAPGRVLACRIRLDENIAPRTVRVIAVLRATDGTRRSTHARVAPARR